MKIDTKIKELHGKMINCHNEYLKERCEIGTFDNNIIPKFAASMWQVIDSHVTRKTKINYLDILTIFKNKKNK